MQTVCSVPTGGQSVSTSHSKEGPAPFSQGASRAVTFSSCVAALSAGAWLPSQCRGVAAFSVLTVQGRGCPHSAHSVGAWQASLCSQGRA